VTEPEAQSPLSAEERDGIVTAVKSVFSRLRKLYTQISPTFVEYGFTPPSPGVLARELSEKIETAIIQHCETFSRGHDHCDLCRIGFDWEVKIAKGSGLTINQSKKVAGETYIVVNYTADVQVKKVWVLWHSDDAMFSARRSNTNARAARVGQAQEQIEVLYKASSGNAKPALAKVGKPKPAKAALPVKNSAKKLTA
jgi:hypothetical protein